MASDKTKQKKRLIPFMGKPQCRYCGSFDKLTIDHKNPVSNGGRLTPDNVQWLCQLCNVRKGNHTEGEIKSMFKWFLEIQKKRKLAGLRPWENQPYLRNHAFVSDQPRWKQLWFSVTAWWNYLRMK